MLYYEKAKLEINEDFLERPGMNELVTANIDLQLLYNTQLYL